MDYLSGIAAYSPVYGIGSSSAITSLLSASGLSTPEVFGGSSTFVEISGLGQLLSAATTFQDQLRALQPGTATSGGGQNFGTDFASLAAETQSLVDAFNGLQSTIASVNGAGSLFGAGVTGAAGLEQSLGTLAQAGYDNGNSTLTNLSALGVTYTPSAIPGGGSLSIDLAALQSAYNSDQAGAFSLLGTVATALADQAGSFVGEAGGRYSALAALAQTSLLTGSLTSSFLPGSLDFGNLLLGESLNGNVSLQQAILAINQYALISNLIA